MTDELHPLAQAQIQAHDALAPTIAAEQKAHLVDVLEHFESDIAPLIAPFVQQVVNDPATPDHVRALLSPLTAPQHFGESIIVGIAVGSILSPVLTAIFDPVLIELAKHPWELAVGGPSIKPLGGVPLTPDLLAAATLKGVLTETDGARIASQSGTSADSFHTMFETAGQSLGLAEALLLERRGQFVNITLEDVLRYSNMNPKFYASAANLKYIPPSVGEVLTGWLKEKLPPNLDPATMIGHAGIDPAHFGWLSQSAGRPLTWLEMFRAHHRGYPGTITPEQSLAESDIHPRYKEVIPYLQYNYPPLFQLIRLLHAGTITPTRAATILKYEGYEKVDIDAIIAAPATGSGTVKELSQAQIVQSYENQLLDHPTALTRLEALKYSAGDATALLDLADEKRKTALLTATVNMVGHRFVAYKLGKADATHLLNTAGIPQAAQFDLFKLWAIERDANVHVPTVASIVGAGRRALLTPLQVQTRLTQLGVALDDMAIFVADGWPPTHAAEARAAAHAVTSGATVWPSSGIPSGPTGRTLTVTQIGKLYTAGTIGNAEATADLVALGYSAAQAAELLTTFPPHVPPVP